MGVIGTSWRNVFSTQTARIGTTATLKRSTTTGYNAGTSQATVTQASYSVKGVSEETGNFSEVGQRQGTFHSDSTDVRATTRTFLIPSVTTAGTALAFDPATGDVLTIGGRDYRIAMAETVTADDVVIFHRLFLDFA